MNPPPPQQDDIYDDHDRRGVVRESYARLEVKLDSMMDRLNNVIIQSGQTGLLLERHTEQVNAAITEIKKSQLDAKTDLKELIVENRHDINTALREHSDNPAPHATTLGKRLDELEARVNKVWGGLIIVGALGTSGLVALFKGLGL